MPACLLKLKATCKLDMKFLIVLFNRNYFIFAISGLSSINIQYHYIKNIKIHFCHNILHTCYKTSSFLPSKIFFNVLMPSLMSVIMSNNISICTVSYTAPPRTTDLHFLTTLYQLQKFWETFILVFFAFSKMSSKLMHRFDRKRLGVKVEILTVDKLWSHFFSKVFSKTKDKLVLYKDQKKTYASIGHMSLNVFWHVVHLEKSVSMQHNFWSM